ncbi:DEKNAAC105440 [Brettanomyces naardenensis]|uniref:DEKNAAC105440 n=1 Tax=Brettanomyces naardenensis TaxID=13370 RepID=A0A448YTG2_BRENA|nr:DEKNAAC105440 [Brettanomyces naardenensis]
MKFGKYLAARQLEFPEYAGHFINYKALKKLINALTQDTSTPLQDKKGSFFFRLERELEKVNDFYLKKESQLKFRLDILISKKEKYFQSHQLPNGGGKINKNSVNFVSLYDGFKKFSKDLDRLEQFVELNETGFTKVLKKWDKRSKSSTKELYLTTAVNVQPVFHRSQIIELSDMVANNLMELESLVDGDTSFVRYEGRSNGNDVDGKLATPSKYSIASSSKTPSPSSSSSAAGACDELYTDFYEITVQNANLSQDDQMAKIKEWSSQIISRLPDATKKYTLSKVFLLLIPNLHIPDASLLQFYEFFKDFIDLRFVDDLNGRNCLIEASTCKQNRTAIVELLLKSDLDPTMKDVSGRTCLHYVTENGRDDLLLLLLSSKKVEPIIDAMDNESISSLLLAIVNDHVSCVQTLLQHGANGFPLQDDLKPKYLPLNVACKIGNFEVVKLILNRYGSPEKAKGDNLLTNNAQCNAEGLLPLHIVASSGHPLLLPLLLQYGADVNQLDKLNKWSPIFYAVVEGYDVMVHELIGYGANFKLEDEDGCDPLYYAIWEGNVAVLNVLMDADKEEGEKMSETEEPEPKFATPAAPSILSIPRSLGPSTSTILPTSLDMIPDLSLPPPIIPLRKYGHNFLEKKIFLKLSFYTSRNSIRLNPDTFLTSIPGRITISCDKNDLIPRNLLLPVLDNDKSITFQADSFDDSFNIEFELFRTFGTRLLAKATLPSSVLTTSYPGSGSKLSGDLEIPLADVKLRNTGFLRFNYEIVYPYSGAPLEISMYDTYWKSSSVADEKEKEKEKLQQQQQQQLQQQQHQNTSVSFVTASSLTGVYYRVHLYLLNDGTPIVCPKYLVEVGGGVSLPVCCFNFEQLRNLMYKDASEYQRLCDELRLLKNGSGPHFCEIMGRLYIPLSQFLDTVDPEIALNLEIFYPSVYELEFYDIKLFTSVSANELVHKCNVEASLNTLTDNCLNNFIDLILTDIFGHVRKLRHNNNSSRSRSLILSSDNSSVCTILNWKQPNYPVFYNLNGVKYSGQQDSFYECTANGFSKHDRINLQTSGAEELEKKRQQDDHRNLLIDNIDSINKDSSEYINSLQYQDKLSRSIKLATDFASSNNLLGITVPNQLLKICPTMAKSIRSNGLILVATKDEKGIGSKQSRNDAGADVNGLRFNDILSFKDTIDM